MPIIKYNPSKVYDPKTFKNAVRRASKANIEYSYTPIALQSQALRLLLSVPLVRETILFIAKQGQKFLKMEEQNRYKMLVSMEGKIK